MSKETKKSVKQKISDMTVLEAEKEVIKKKLELEDAEIQLSNARQREKDYDILKQKNDQLIKLISDKDKEIEKLSQYKTVKKITTLKEYGQKIRDEVRGYEKMPQDELVHLADLIEEISK